MPEGWSKPFDSILLTSNPLKSLFIIKKKILYFFPSINSFPHTNLKTVEPYKVIASHEI